MTKAKKHEDLEQLLGELTLDLQRTRADFENYRKRAETEKSMARANGRIGAIAQLLPVIDTIERHDIDVLLDFFIVKLASNKALYSVDSIFRIRNTLALGDLPYETFAFLVDSNDAWRRAVAFGVCDNFRFAGNHIGDG